MRNSLGPLTPFNPPTVDMLRNYAVNRAGQLEVIWQPQYEYQTYGTAGATQFTFFQTTVGASSTTLANTSMKAAGQFPAPTEFLVTGIQVYFRPGNAVAQVGAVTLVQENWNDVNDVLFGLGWLDFFIGSKSYLTDGPISKFTQQFRIAGGGWQADSTTAGAAQKTFIDYATHTGRYYAITPVKLQSNQNFNVTLNFPTAITVPVAGRIGVILDGFLYRLSQ